MKIKRFFQHRVNSISHLKKIDQFDGCEIDLRSNGQQLYLHHDPYKIGCNFEDWLNEYNNAGIILNVKEEGLEPKIISILNQRNIDDYFFLDQSIPFLHKTGLNVTKKIAVRFSEFEPLNYCKLFSGFCEWVWIDSFNGSYFAESQIKELKKCFKLCLMSPELRGFSKDIISELKTRYFGIDFDAVCTKDRLIWQKV